MTDAQPVRLPEDRERTLASMSAEQRIRWALASLPGTHVVSSSFGAQSAVMLDLMTRVLPDIPVVLVDTGYLFAETYRFIEELTDRLGLNLCVYRPLRSAAWQEATDGRRWERGVEGLDDYNRENKVEPMERALEELAAGTWFAGLRRQQSAGRAATPLIEASGTRFKLCPIADWSDRDVHRYLKWRRLPYHPLWASGYVSIGDVHSTRSLAEVESIDETRFSGLKRECGLHEMDFGKSA